MNYSSSVQFKSSPLVSSYGLVTGVIIALKGSIDEEGYFHVAAIAYPSMTRPQATIAPPMEDKWIVLASGLNAGALDSFSLSLHILLKFVAGKAGAACDISRMILAGNSLGPAKRLAFANKNKRFGTDYAPIDTAPVCIIY